MAATQNLRVIVAHGAKQFRDLALDMLHSLDVAEGLEAEDAEATLSRIEQTIPDTALVDEDLPGLDVLELTRKIRHSRNATIQRMAVILLTGSPSREFIEAARLSGIDEVLCKPISMAALNQRLANATQHRREFIETESYTGPCRRKPFPAPYKGVERRASSKP